MAIADNFDRANNDSLGSPWTESEEGADALAVVGNRLRAKSAKPADAQFHGLARYEETPADDQYVQAVWRGFLAGSKPRSGLLVRLTLGSVYTLVEGYYLLYEVDGAASTLQIITMDRGLEFYEFANVLNTATYQLSVGDLVRFEVSGFAFTVKVNGGTVLTATDGSLTYASGRTGAAVVRPLATDGSGDAWGEWDDFEGGAVTVQPEETGPIASEAALLGAETPRPGEYGPVAFEMALSGIVSPELVNLPWGEYALLGTDEPSGPAPTTRIVRKRATPVTWES